MEQRRVLLALAIPLLIVAFYQALAANGRYPPAEPTPVPTQDSGPAAAPGASGTTERAAAPEAPAKPAIAPELAASARDVVVDTELYRATFTTLGARLKSLELKRYSTTVK